MVGKKKRGHPDIEEILARSWCFYCERDFDDLKILISHQKAKHFKCERCGRRLNTAGGLSVHMNQVHKETLTNVENALPNRQGLEVEIFGMEGIPEDVLQTHNQRIIAQFYQAEADRRAASGNSGPAGSGGGQTKKPKFESPSDLKKRLAEHKARKAEQAANNSSGANTPMEASDSPQIANAGSFNGSPYNAPQAPFNGTQGTSHSAFSQEPFAQPVAAYQQPTTAGPPNAFAPQFSPPPQFPAQSSFPPPIYQQPPHGFQGVAPPYAGSPPAFGAYQPPLSYTPPQHGHIPNRPSSLPPPPGLPQRPAFGAPPVPPHQMQQMHQGGQQFSQQNHWAGSGWNGQDSKPSGSLPNQQTQGYGNHVNNASTLDDLVAGQGREPDDVDEAIRLAIAGIKPPPKTGVAPDSTSVSATNMADVPKPQSQTPAPDAPKQDVVEKKAKKDKSVKMIYSDNETSPEERMAKFARYAFVPETQA